MKRYAHNPRAFSAYFDPNYDPELMYTQIEPLLLVYDRVFVYAPLAAHAQEAKLDPARLLRLIRTGYVVPVAREGFWDQREREARVAKFLKSDAARAARFRWTDFDEELQSWKHRREVNYERGTQWASTLYDSPAFRQLSGEVGRLRQQLPEQFLMAAEYVGMTDTQLTERLLYHLGGDLEILTQLKEPECIITSKTKEVIQKLYSTLLVKYPYQLNRVLPSPDENERDRLDEKDCEIAIEFAGRVCRQYDISDILPEYKQSKFNKCFRTFVRQTHLEMVQNRETADVSQALFARFDTEVARLRKKSQVSGRAISIGAMSALLTGIGANAETIRSFLTLFVTSRIELQVIGALAVGALAGASHVSGVAGGHALIEMKAAWEKKGWISLLAFRARERSPFE
jgi:hypothetical protein